jgi:hypothetical protein
VLAALERVGVDAEQAEQAGGGRADAFLEEFVVGTDRLVGRGERLDDRNGSARVAARRVDDEVGRGAEARDPLAVLVPRRQAVLPQLGLL